MRNSDIADSMEIKLSAELPPPKTFDPKFMRAPDRALELEPKEIELALRNALRYIPAERHADLVDEFLEELRTRGRIYAYRFRPEGRIYGKPMDQYEGIPEARALQVMIDNNLDFDVAL